MPIPSCAAAVPPYLLGSPAGNSENGVPRLATTDLSVLDFLRAVAVLLVLGAHFMEATRTESLWWFEERVGWMGVMLFFVHTSLVLMFSLERTPARGTALLNNFYLRRAFRIYPLSITIVLVVLAFGIPVASWPWRPADTSVTTVLANLFLVQDLVYSTNILGPMWSLPLEVQMYVLLPFLFWIIRRGARLDLAVLLAVLAIGFAFVQPHITERANVAQYAPCFMGGLLAFCITKRRVAVLPFWLWTLTLGGALVVFLLLTADRDHPHLMPMSWGLSIAVGLLIPNFRDTTSSLVRRAGSLIAKYSYGIYLTHMIAFWIAFTRLGTVSLWTRGFAGLGLTAVFSAMAYYLVEAPGIRLGGTLAGKWINRGVPPVATTPVP